MKVADLQEHLRAEHLRVLADSLHEARASIIGKFVEAEELADDCAADFEIRQLEPLRPSHKSEIEAALTSSVSDSNFMLAEQQTDRSVGSGTVLTEPEPEEAAAGTPVAREDDLVVSTPLEQDLAIQSVKRTSDEEDGGKPCDLLLETLEANTPEDEYQQLADMAQKMIEQGKLSQEIASAVCKMRRLSQEIAVEADNHCVLVKTSLSAATQETSEKGVLPSNSREADGISLQEERIPTTRQSVVEQIRENVEEIPRFISGRLPVAFTPVLDRRESSSQTSTKPSMAGSAPSSQSFVSTVQSLPGSVSAPQSTCLPTPIVKLPTANVATSKRNRSRPKAASDDSNIGGAGRFAMETSAPTADSSNSSALIARPSGTNDNTSKAFASIFVACSLPSEQILNNEELNHEKQQDRHANEEAPSGESKNRSCPQSISSILSAALTSSQVPSEKHQDTARANSHECPAAESAQAASNHIGTESFACPSSPITSIDCGAFNSHHQRSSSESLSAISSQIEGPRLTLRPLGPHRQNIASLFPDSPSSPGSSTPARRNSSASLRPLGRHSASVACNSSAVPNRGLVPVEVATSARKTDVPSAHDKLDANVLISPSRKREVPSSYDRAASPVHNTFLSSFRGAVPPFTGGAVPSSPSGAAASPIRGAISLSPSGAEASALRGGAQPSLRRLSPGPSRPVSRLVSGANFGDALAPPASWGSAGSASSNARAIESSTQAAVGAYFAPLSPTAQPRADAPDSFLNQLSVQTGLATTLQSMLCEMRDVAKRTNPCVGRESAVVYSRFGRLGGKVGIVDIGTVGRVEGSTSIARLLLPRLPSSIVSYQIRQRSSPQGHAPPGTQLRLAGLPHWPPQGGGVRELQGGRSPQSNVTAT